MKVLQWVIISLIFHVVLTLVLWVISYLMALPAPTEPPRTWIEFRDDDKRSPLPGEVTKRVEKETRTKETSPTTISAPTQPHERSVPTQGAKFNDPSLGKKLRALSPSTDDVFLQSSNTASSLKQQLDSFLPPDLEIGDAVALNTDQNLFFTFYSRMAQKVVYPWALNVVSGFEKMKATGQLGRQRKAWATVIEVILDKKGNVVSTQPLQLAGDWDIDSAPIKAFKQAKTFPNPPKEMVDEDGYIHIRYKFLVYYNPM